MFESGAQVAALERECLACVVDGRQQQVPAVAEAGVGPQQVSAPCKTSTRFVEHTPVSGNVSSTRRAPSTSPTSAHTTERTCS
jgi:hypothetical protein